MRRGYLLFPLGCVRISEVMAPTGYVLSEQILLGYIRQPRSGEQALGNGRERVYKS